MSFGAVVARNRAVVSSDKWSRALRPKTCRRCEQAIPAGVPFRYVTRSNWTYCEACAKALLGEDAPEGLPWPVQAKPSTMESFNAFRMRQALRRNMLDYRAKQAGE
jgi:hypothetical protein